MENVINQPCIVCGSRAAKTMFPARDRMFDLAGIFFEKKCQTCGLLRLSPMPTAQELKKYYPPGNYYSYGVNARPSLFWRLRSYLILHSVRQNTLSRLISLFIRVPAIPAYVPGGKIMDVGCGSGDTLVLLKKIGWDVYGLDIDAAAIRVAHTRGLAKVTLGGYTSLQKYPDHSFDAIRLYHVIEHLDNPELCLKIIKKKLKRGGQLIIGTPNCDSWLAGIGKQYWYNLDAPRHLFVFSPKTLQRFLVEQKFRVTATRFCSGGGILGTIQYLLSDLLHKKISLIHNTFLVACVYPIEYCLDRLGVGDIVDVHAVNE